MLMYLSTFVCVRLFVFLCDSICWCLFIFGSVCVCLSVFECFCVFLKAVVFVCDCVCV